MNGNIYKGTLEPSWCLMSCNHCKANVEDAQHEGQMVWHQIHVASVNTMWLSAKSKISLQRGTSGGLIGGWAKTVTWSPAIFRCRKYTRVNNPNPWPSSTCYQCSLLVVYLCALPLSLSHILVRPGLRNNRLAGLRAVSRLYNHPRSALLL